MADPRVEALENAVDDINKTLATLKIHHGISLPEAVKPPYYDGRTDFQNYIRQFNKYATACQWSAARCT